MEDMDEKEKDVLNGELDTDADLDPNPLDSEPIDPEATKPQNP